MIDKEKLEIAKSWIDKLANGVNPLNDELVKEDELINNVHISRCLFYVSELLGEIKVKTSVERRIRNPFFLSTKDAENIPITEPNGIANFVKLVNGYIQDGMKPLSTAQVIKWLRSEGLIQEVQKEDGRNTNLPTEKGNLIGITTELRKNLEGNDYLRVMYSIEAQRFMLKNIEAIATF